MQKQIYLGSLIGLLIVGGSNLASAESPEPDNQVKLEIARGCNYVDIKADEALEKGDSIECNEYRLTLQRDGNLVLYRNGQPLWATGSEGQGATKFLMQQDGNVVLYQGNKPLFATDTDGNSGAYLRLQSDGNLVVYSRSGQPLWATNTEGGRRVHTDAAIQWQEDNGVRSSDVMTEQGPDYFRGNGFYTSNSNNPFHPRISPSSIGGNLSSRGNCTWYAYGRALELGGNSSNMGSMKGNAAEWRGTNVSRNEVQRGDIVQWQEVFFDEEEGEYFGHVAVVEKVKSDGSIVVSESGYNEKPHKSWLHRVRTIPASGGSGIKSLKKARFLRVK